MARGEIGQPGGRREAAIPAPLHRLVEGRGIAGGVGLFDRVEVEFGHGAVLLRWLLFCFAQRHEDTKRLYAGPATLDDRAKRTPFVSLCICASPIRQIGREPGRAGGGTSV